jgi:hypothetical protein
VFRNQGDGRFRDVSRKMRAPISRLAGQYRGAAFADFDNDGRVDVVVSNVNGPARLYRNITPKSRTLAGAAFDRDAQQSRRHRSQGRRDLGERHGSYTTTAPPA